MSTKLNSISAEWPALPYAGWESTLDTLHMWTQIVGKTRMALEPRQNHWWNVTLYVTPLGLTTSPMPYRGQTFVVDFDFVAHRLVMQTSDGRQHMMRLGPCSVAAFYTEYMSALKTLGIEVKIDRKPAEFDDTTPHDLDDHHASYDRLAVERFQNILVHTDRILKKFRSRFLGKCSPVHFFWGSFDLAVTRFTGELAPENPQADSMTREAYSHEVSSCGFWPGNRQFPHAAFYAYAAPAPDGFAKQPVRPSAAGWDTTLGEFILKYDDVRSLPDPEAAILDFCQSTYEAAANAGHWNRQVLERRSSSK
jgi:hypothetical protein